MELESRPCRQCFKKFKCLPSSKQEFCSYLCGSEHVRTTGSEEKWQQKKKEMKRMEHSRLVIGAMVGQQNKSHDVTKYASRSIAKGIPTIRSSELKKSLEIAPEKSGNVPTQNGKNNLIRNAPNESAREKKMIQAIENEKQSTSFNGIRGIEKFTKNDPKPTEGIEIPSSESSQQLTLVKEVISSQMSYIDRSADLIMQRMEQLNRNQYDSDNKELVRQPSMTDIEQTIQLARVMNDLMRTKKDALKTIHEMVVTK